MVGRRAWLGDDAPLWGLWWHRGCLGPDEVIKGVVLAEGCMDKWVFVAP